MSSTPNRASNAASKSRRKDVSYDLTTARQMLPLVRSIVTDAVSARHAITRLTPEQERLDRHRRDLVWLERQRRYQVTDEIATAEKSLTSAVTELSTLGVNLVNDEVGEVDFPTSINGRTAVYTWQLGEDGVRHWHYSGEELRRPIPADWEQGHAATPVRYRGQGQP